MDWNDFFDNFGEYAVRGFGYLAIIFFIGLGVVLLGFAPPAGLICLAIGMGLIALMKHIDKEDS